MRRTLADLLSSRIPAALNLCATDTDGRIAALANEAQERLLDSGTWWGSHCRYKCYSEVGTLVWPRQIASILGASVLNEPTRVRDLFWEFNLSGIGIQGQLTGTQILPGCTIGSQDLLDRGEMAVWNQMTGIVSKVKVYCDLASDATKQILILGRDENGNWIRTLQGGVMLDGELVSPSQLGTLTTNIFSFISDVQKPDTDGPIRLYAYNTVTLAQSLVAVFEYDENRPMYRVSYVPKLDNQTSGSTGLVVEVIAKLAFIPVKRATDYLIIQCLPAMKDMMCAIDAAEKETTMDAKTNAILKGLALAKVSLNAELQHYVGVPQSRVSVEGTAGLTSEQIISLV